MYDQITDIHSCGESQILLSPIGVGTHTSSTHLNNLYKVEIFFSLNEKTDSNIKLNEFIKCQLSDLI